MADEHIGVLLVHGIGSQKPNEHLIGEAHKIVAAIGEQVASINVTAEPPIAKEMPHKFVADFAKNIVRVDVVTKSNSRLCLEFNEVYWAELGEAATLARQVKFWFWALSMWSVAGRESSILDGFKQMYVPRGDRFRAIYRLQLAFLGGLFLLGAGTVGLYNMIADRLKLPRVLISDILTDYVGDVMLYGQPGRDSDPAVSELGEPPRAEIRGRMVDAMVEFALRDYDRWYVVAHSLGTVVAYNGLMEIEAALPNYLTKARWDEIGVKGSQLLKTLDADVPDLMLPRRPTWLSRRDGIDRRALFAKLRGFLTYGSAIGKFHGIWPIMVPCNKQEFVFNEHFKWINVYDSLDPVSGPLKGYTTKLYGLWDDALKAQGPKDCTLTKVENGRTWSAAKISENLSYRAGKVWLLSHLGYLTHPSAAYTTKGYLVFPVARWLESGNFQKSAFARLNIGPWEVLWRSGVAFLEVMSIALAIWLGTAYLMWSIPQVHAHVGFIESTDWIFCALSAFFLAFFVNYLIEVVARAPRIPRWARVGIVAVALFGACHLDAALKIHPNWTVGGLVAIVVQFGVLSGLRLFPNVLELAVSRVAIVLASTTIGAVAGYCVHTQWGAMLDTAILDGIVRLAEHPLRLLAVGLISLTVLLIVGLGVCRWLFQPIPLTSR